MMQEQGASKRQEENQNNENNGDNKNDKSSFLQLRIFDKQSVDQCFQKLISKENGKEISLYISNNHANRVFDMMNELKKIAMLSDVTLMTDNGLEIRAHKIILSTCSPYFYAIFRNFSEREENCITIKDVDHDILKLLVDFMYSAEIHITEDNVQSLLAAANLLRLTVIVNACSDFLLRQLHPSNCLGIRAFADQYDCLGLLAQTDGYIEHYFSDIIQCEEFLLLSAQQLVKLISNDRLAVTSEENVFECVISWINHDQEKRKEYLVQLFGQLFERVWKEKLIQENSQCKDYLIEALKYILLNKIKEPESWRKSFEFRTPRELPKVIIVVGGKSLKAARSVECLNLETNTWYPLSDSPTDFCGGGIVLLDGKIYTVGGSTLSGTSLRNMNVYDPSTDQWSACPEMMVKRSNLGVAILLNKIYAVGGRNGDMIHRSVEVYDPKIQEWAMTDEMPAPLTDVVVGVFNDYLYVFGECAKFRGNSSKKVLRYDPYRRKWTEETEMKIPIRNVGLTFSDNDFYIVEGSSTGGGSVTENCMVYNTCEKNRWPLESIMDIPDDRKNAAVVQLNGFVYVIGGHNGKKRLASVKVYDEKRDCWKDENSMNIARSEAGAVIIDKPHNYL